LTRTIIGHTNYCLGVYQLIYSEREIVPIRLHYLSRQEKNIYKFFWKRNKKKLIICFYLLHIFKQWLQYSIKYQDMILLLSLNNTLRYRNNTGHILVKGTTLIFNLRIFFRKYFHKNDWNTYRGIYNTRVTVGRFYTGILLYLYIGCKIFYKWPYNILSYIDRVIINFIKKTLIESIYRMDKKKIKEITF